MATVDELFAQMEENGAYQDAHDVILIDPVTRTLKIPATELILGVEGDVRGERKYFGCPCIVGNDVCLTDSDIHINYTNAENEVGCFKVSDITESSDLVVFSWEITDKVVALRGDVQFVICICHKSGAEREWHTTNAVGKVLPGIDRGDAEIEEDSIWGGGVGNAVLGMAVLGMMVLGQSSQKRLKAPTICLTSETLAALEAPVIYLDATGSSTDTEFEPLAAPVIYLDADDSTTDPEPELEQLNAPVIYIYAEADVVEQLTAPTIELVEV